MHAINTYSTTIMYLDTSRLIKSIAVRAFRVITKNKTTFANEPGNEVSVFVFLNDVIDFAEICITIIAFPIILKADIANFTRGKRVV